MIAWLRAHWRWLLPLATFAAGWFAHRPQPAVHEVTTASSVVAQTAHAEASKTEDVKLEQHRVAAPTVTVRTRYLPGKCGEQQQLAETIETRTGPVTVDTRRAETDTTTARSESQSVAEQKSTLDLTITPQARAGWALGVGLEDVLGGRTLRVSARRRLFGPFWAEAAVQPATRALGVGLAVEW